MNIVAAAAHTTRHIARNVFTAIAVRRACRVGLGAVIAAWLLLPTSTWTQPGVRYVSPVDPRCGGRSPCYRTIQAAVSAALPGETVELQPGTYREQVSISGKNNTSGATEAARIVIQADPAAPLGSVVVTPPATQCTNGHAFRVQQSRFVTLRGLTITGAGGPAVSLLGGNNQNRAIHLERLRIFANGSIACNGGITINQGNAGTVIANSLVHANGRNGISFIDADGGPHYVVQNTVHANQWNGITIARNHQVLLANNAITDNGTGAGSTGGRHGIAREFSTGPQPEGLHLLNNLLCGNRLGEISGPALDPTDAGNLTPSASEGPGVGAVPGCGLPGAIYRAVDGPDGTAETGDDDFTLAPGSPALDAGVDLRRLGLGPTVDALLEADYAGPAARPKDGSRSGTPRFDIGALELAPPNRPPVANAGRDRTVLSDAIANLDGSASYDPDGDPLTFRWSQTAGPTVSLSRPMSAAPGFVAPRVTTRTALTFHLLVSDGALGSEDSVTILVIPPSNRPPTIDPIADQTVAAGETVAFTVSAADPDGDRITLSVSPLPLPANATFDASTGLFSFAPAEDQAGSFALTFSADDGRGGLASTTATVTVTSSFRVTITSPAAGAAVPVGMVVVQGSMQSTNEDVGITVNGVPAALQAATFAVQVPVDLTVSSLAAVATSATGATATHSVPIAVSPGVPAPLLIASPSTGTAPLAVTFTLLGGRPPTSIVLDLVGDGGVDFSGPTLDGQTFFFPTPGLYFPRATVTDPAGVTTVSTAVVQVLDASQLDTLLQARWAAMKSSLRAGDIPGALQAIVESARPGYEEAFQAIASSLLPIDTILTGIAPLHVHNMIAVYEARRNDDGIPMLFEVRFAVDSDGVWRLQSF